MLSRVTTINTKMYNDKANRRDSIESKKLFDHHIRSHERTGDKWRTNNKIKNLNLISLVITLNVSLNRLNTNYREVIISLDFF